MQFPVHAPSPAVIRRSASVACESRSAMHLKSISEQVGDIIPHAKASNPSAYSNLSHPLLDGSFSKLAPMRTFNWLRPLYDVTEFETSVIAPGPLPLPWDRGIARLDISALAASGLKPSWCLALSRVLNLGLTTLPPVQAKPPDNYSSIYEFGDLVEMKLQSDIDKGILEIIPDSQLHDPSSRFWFHPIRAVPIRGPQTVV